MLVSGKQVEEIQGSDWSLVKESYCTCGWAWLRKEQRSERSKESGTGEYKARGQLALAAYALIPWG